MGDAAAVGRWKQSGSPAGACGVTSVRSAAAGRLPRAVHTTVAGTEDPPGWRLEVREGGEVVAEATIGLPVAGIGVLWWIGVAPAARGRGLGLALLGSSLDVLAGLGADR